MVIPENEKESKSLGCLETSLLTARRNLGPNSRSDPRASERDPVGPLRPSPRRAGRFPLGGAPAGGGLCAGGGFSSGADGRSAPKLNQESNAFPLRAKYSICDPPTLPPSLPPARPPPPRHNDTVWQHYREISN